MDFIEIYAKDNPLIKLASLLQVSHKARVQNNLFVLEGLRICMDAAENSIEFDKLIITKSAYEKHKTHINNFAKKSNKSYIVSENLFKKISDTSSPQGIIVLAKIPSVKIEISDKNRYIALENIADPANLGAVSRSAEALGIDGIILSSNGCDPYSPKSLRSSMGTLLRVPLYITDDVSDFIKQHNLKGYACVVDKNAENINSVKFLNGSVLMIGNEANGLSEKSKKEAFKLVTIPMQGKAESLNAAAAAAIAMWEMVRVDEL